MFVRVADYLGNAGKGGDFFWCALRVTAGDHDLRIRILTMNTPNGGPSVLIGRGSYGAGVENNKAGLRGLFGALQTAFPQLAFDSGAVGLGGPAAEVCHVESCHVSILT